MEKKDYWWAFIVAIYLGAVTFYAGYQIYSNWPGKSTATELGSDQAELIDQPDRIITQDTTDYTSVAEDTLEEVEEQESSEKPGNLQESMLLRLIFFTGVLGGLLHGWQSLASFLGSKKFYRRWTYWYIIRPIVGGILAYIIYVVLRGGLIPSNGTNTAEINIYGFLAIAALSGLFSDLATVKLKEIFKNVFSIQDERSDKLDNDK